MCALERIEGRHAVDARPGEKLRRPRVLAARGAVVLEAFAAILAAPPERLFGGVGEQWKRLRALAARLGAPGCRGSLEHSLKHRKVERAVASVAEVSG